MRITINTCEATPLEIDWLTAKHFGFTVDGEPKLFRFTGSGRLAVRHNAHRDHGEWHPSANPAQGLPILEQNHIATKWHGKRLGWSATWPVWVPDDDDDGLGLTLPVGGGPTILIAGLRCFLEAKLGPTAEVPEELLP